MCPVTGTQEPLKDEHTEAGQGGPHRYALDSRALDPYPGSREGPRAPQAQPPRQKGLDPLTLRGYGE